MHDGRDDLRDHHPEHGARQAVEGADADAREPQAHRDREERAADVVPAAQDDRSAGDALGRLEQRDGRREEHRDEHVVHAPDLPRERRQHDQRERPEKAADQLEGERDLEDPAQPAPAARLGVAEAVLDERLLDGQVEQQLQEGRRGDDRGEARVVPGAELPGRHDRGEESERGRNVDPEHRRRASPEDTGAHRRHAV